LWQIKFISRFAPTDLYCKHQDAVAQTSFVIFFFNNAEREARVSLLSSHQLKVGLSFLNGSNCFVTEAIGLYRIAMKFSDKDEPNPESGPRVPSNRSRGTEAA
jgi:hypothetical protein